MKGVVKHIVSVLVIMFLRLPMQAQNLVPDPSFEILVPQWIGQDTIWVSGSQGYPFYKPEEYLVHWKNPSTLATPDYRHLRSIGEYNPLCPVPGPQLPRTGEGMVGLVTYGNEGYPNGREYLYIELIEALEAGKWYKAGFYVSYPDVNRLANNNLGILFTTMPLNYSHTYTLDTYPQIEHQSIITDKVNWAKVEGFFRADSSYTFLTFGNFKNDSETESSVVNPNQFYWDSGYYWFDDVFVVPIGAKVQGDTLVCPGHKAIITAAGDVQWAWAEAGNPGQIIGTDSVLTVYPTQTTCYIFYGLTDTLVHTVQVYPIPPDPFTASDTVLCAGTVLNLMPQVTPQAQYVWHTGQQGGDITVNSQGTYGVDITDGPCAVSDSIRVYYTFAPYPAMLPDTAFCPGDPIELSVHIPHSDYLWSTGHSGNSLLVNTGGSYSLTVSNVCGANELFFEVVQKDCPCRVWIPNAFTPDGDGINEGFRPVTDCRLLEYEWFVYDRWGTLQYSAQKPDDVWTAENAAPGVYAVKVSIKGKDNLNMLNQILFKSVLLIK